MTTSAFLDAVVPSLPRWHAAAHPFAVPAHRQDLLPLGADPRSRRHALRQVGQEDLRHGLVLRPRETPASRLHLGPQLDRTGCRRPGRQEGLGRLAVLDQALPTQEELHLGRLQDPVRHAALCMALITWTEVWIHRVHPALWPRPFAAKLAALRAETITQTIFTSGPRARGSRRIAQGLASIFTSATATG